MAQVKKISTPEPETQLNQELLWKQFSSLLRAASRAEVREPQKESAKLMVARYYQDWLVQLWGVRVGKA